MVNQDSLGVYASGRAVKYLLQYRTALTTVVLSELLFYTIVYFITRDLISFFEEFIFKFVDTASAKHGLTRILHNCYLEECNIRKGSI